MSKNTFTVLDNVIEITRPDWDFSAYATVREDYLEEIQSVTWGLNNDRYPYNTKLGTLHSYIMKKWYGDSVCEEMKNKGFVIDHLDNVSHNCLISNLCFLLDSYNKAKGLTFDQENKDKELIALTMFKDFETNPEQNLFQITIVFNYPATLKLTDFKYPAVIELAYLLYEGDYRKVILDAHSILLNYKENYLFEPEKLNFIDYHIEGCIGRNRLTPAAFLDRKKHGGYASFNRKMPLNNWTKDKKDEYFIIDDSYNEQIYKIKLDIG